MNNKNKKNLINNIFDKYIKKYEIIFIEEEFLKNKKVKDEIVKRCDNKIYFIYEEYLSKEGLEEIIKLNNEIIKKGIKSLNIIAIYKKISKLDKSIIKEVIKEFPKIIIIKLNSKYILKDKIINMKIKNVIKNK